MYLYEDTNNNGVIDVLTDAKVLTTTTNASGLYSFTNLAIGMNYLVDVDQTDPDLINYFSPNAFVSTTPDPGRVTNLTGSYLNADFGFFKNLPGSIGDAVCRDVNSDGLCTAADTGIPNVTVWLYRDADADGMPDPEELAITATTSITGYIPSRVGTG